ncbi:MAG: sulfatase [Pirellulales bacterium]|nr:sulfatase [Pirellulales bacterium]
MICRRFHCLPILTLFLFVFAACVYDAWAQNETVDVKKKTSPRNVLLYVVDDQGSDDASCYGNSVIKTPGLDSLAEEGTRFTRAFCTTSSCSASRSVILTGLVNHTNGQYGHQHGYNHFSSFSEIKSLPVLLEKAGFRTACFGKYHVAPKEVYRFGEYHDTTEPAVMAGQAKEFITADPTQPFFLYFCTTEPHRPFVRGGSDVFNPADVIVPPYLPDTPECRQELANYYGSVQRADKGLLRLIEILKQSSRWENTLVIYISDNGIAFPGAKTTLYEPGMRLPCVVRNPFAKKFGVVTDAMVTWADLTPTILDFAGALPKKPWFHGRSFLSVLEEEHPTGWDEIYASHTFHEITMYYPMRVVHTERYKYILNLANQLPYPFASDLYASSTWQGILSRGDKLYGARTVEAYLHRPRHELYELQSDPNEVKNLANDPRYAKVLAQMQAKLEAWQRKTKDPWVVKYKHE